MIKMNETRKPIYASMFYHTNELNAKIKKKNILMEMPEISTFLNHGFSAYCISIYRDSQRLPSEMVFFWLNLIDAPQTWREFHVTTSFCFALVYAACDTHINFQARANDDTNSRKGRWT